MAEPPPRSTFEATSKLAPAQPADDWDERLLRLLEGEPSAQRGGRIIVVPDSNTAYAVQRFCVSPEQVSRRCLTARYVISGRPALGTMLASFVSDLVALRDRELETLGDLVDQNQGAHWATFASRVASSPAWLNIVDGQLPLAVSSGRFEPSAPSNLFSLFRGPSGEASSPDAPGPVLGEDECLVLLLDSEYGTSDLIQIVNELPRGVLLVVTNPLEHDLAPLSELIGGVMSLPRHAGTPPSSDRMTYEDSALASDRPADVDALGMTGLALTTAKLLMHEGTGSICIGVEAPWGKGKSSFLRLVCHQAERQAESNPGGHHLLAVDFNAWVYNSAEQAWAGLAAEVIAAIEAHLSWGHRKALSWSYAWHHRKGLLIGSLTTGVLAVFVAVLVAALAGWKVDSGPVSNPLALTLATVSPAGVALIVLVGAAYRLTRPVSQRVHEYLARPDHGVRRGYQNEVVSDLRFTLGTLRRYQPTARVVVMVDDLDRCAEDKVVEILQAINVVLAQSDVYTLLAIDGDMVRRAVFRHYRDSSEDSLPEEFQLDEQFPHEYLEKIVQFSIQLPPTGVAARSAYVRSLFTVPPAPDPATMIVASPDPSATGTVRQGLELDMTLVAPVSIGDFTDRPMADTPAEADAMARYHLLLDDNAREIKRAVNVHRFVKIALYRSESPPSEEIQRRLVLWVLLCLAEPKAVRELLNRSDLDASIGDLLGLIHEPFARRGIDLTDQLPGSDLPLLVAAANLIHLVGPPGRPQSTPPAPG